jgi:hypothetical protein
MEAILMFFEIAMVYHSFGCAPKQVRIADYVSRKHLLDLTFHGGLMFLAEPTEMTASGTQF